MSGPSFSPVGEPIEIRGIPTDTASQRSGKGVPRLAVPGNRRFVMLRAASAQPLGSRDIDSSGPGPDPLLPAGFDGRGRVFSYPKGDSRMSRSPRWSRFVVAAALALAVASPALAGTTGKLTGRVVDEKKQPLPGVNVRVEGQRLGGISDDQGNYFIIGIPGGHYAVKMNIIGYAAYTAENVEITPDFTTTLDATMKTEAVQMHEVVVNAQRPLLQKDATGTTRFLSSDDIQKLPTRGYRDAAAQQAGVVN